MPQILKFQDSSGRTLYGQYTEDDLKEFLQKMTTDGEANELPQLLVFKVDSGTRYYVYKKKVSQVIVRLCNEAHESIAKQLEDHWYDVMLDYDRLPEMTNASEFEACLHEMVEKNSPILYSLLNANFMTILSYENDEDNLEGFRLFVDGKLLPYSNLLMLKNSKILSNAKARLPFYYTVPVISWIMSLFNNKNKNHSSTKTVVTKNPFEEEEKKSDSGRKLTKTQALAANAKEIAKDLIPEGSSLDRELDYLTKQWNKMISKEAYNNLTEDVNSLIRDYTRRVVKTLSATSFTKERVENLAKTLVGTPNMQKIKDDKVLTEYVILYMLRLVSNFN